MHVWFIGIKEGTSGELAGKHMVRPLFSPSRVFLFSRTFLGYGFWGVNPLAFVDWLEAQAPWASPPLLSQVGL